MPKDAPDAIRQMIQDRHDARLALAEAAKTAAIVELPEQRRGATSRTARRRSAATRSCIAGGGELRVVVPLPKEPTEGGGAMRRS